MRDRKNPVRKGSDFTREKILTIGQAPKNKKCTFNRVHKNEKAPLFRGAFL